MRGGQEGQEADMLAQNMAAVQCALMDMLRLGHTFAGAALFALQCPSCALDPPPVPFL